MIRVTMRDRPNHRGGGVASNPLAPTAIRGLLSRMIGPLGRSWDSRVTHRQGSDLSERTGTLAVATRREPYGDP